MKNNQEEQYLQLLSEILEKGSPRKDRTQVGTKALFGRELRFDLEQGFPLMTTKRVYWKTAFKEILWMLSGSTKLVELLRQNVHIWSEWPHHRFVKETGESISLQKFEQRILQDSEFEQKWGDLGPIYGKQWRRWRDQDGKEIDQVQQVIDDLKHNPSSRRLIWEGWNVGELNQMLLPPCHKHYQFFVDPNMGKLSGSVIQRSADTFLGVAFNIANLALIIHMLAEQTGYKAGEAVWFGLDVHIYDNHTDAVIEQLKREPKAFPTIRFNRKPDSFFDYKLEDIVIENYDPHPAIKAPVAI